MALPASGQISLGDIATEKGGSLDNVSLTTESTTGINTSSPSFPDGATPHAISEFYSYDHNYVAGPSYTTLTIDSVNYYTINTDSNSAGNYQYPMIFATGSGNQIIYGHNGSSTVFYNVGGLVIDASGSIQTVGTPTTVISNAGVSGISQVNSSDRYIAVVRDNSNNGYVRARLFDYNNSTQAITLQGSLTTIYNGRTNNNVTDVTRISDTVVFAVSNRGGTGIGMHKIGISGTTLTATNSYYTFNLSAGTSTTKFMKTGTDSGFVLTQRRTTTYNRYIDYISATSLSGTPSYGTRTQLIDVGGEYLGSQGVKYVGNSYGLLCYVESAPLGGDGKLHVVPLSFSGTTLSSGTEVTTTSTTAADARPYVHDIIIMNTVGSLVYFIAKVGSELALFGTINTSTGVVTKLDEASSFAPSAWTNGSMINANENEQGTQFIIMGNESTTLATITGSIS